MALKTIYHTNLLTGGAATALDSFDGESLLDKDRSFTIIGGALYVHELDADSGLAENSPGVIAPDTNAGSKRWILLGTRYIDADLTFADLGTGFRLSGGNGTSKSLTVQNDATLPGMDTGTAAPVSGTWPRGWVRWNTTPSAGGNKGWVCVTAGTPGTWEVFGGMDQPVLFGTNALTLNDAVTDKINVKAYGAVGDGVTDDTAAINAAIAAVVNDGIGQKNVYIPPGVYLVTDVLTIAEHRTNIVGAGEHNTQILFNPATAKTCFHFTAGASMLVQCSIRGMAFTSGNSVQKTAIKVTDVSFFTVEDVAVYYLFVGNVSTGLHLQGRDAIRVNRSTFNTDRPLFIDQNPNLSSIDIDFASFRDSFFYPTNAAQPCITVADGVNLTNTTFDTVSGAKGKWFFYWNDTTTVANSLNLSFRNCRWEQVDDDTGWMYYIKVAGGLRNLQIDTSAGALANGGAASNGIYMDKVLGASIRECFIADDASSTPIQVENNCVGIAFHNVMFSRTTPTITIGSDLMAKINLRRDDGGIAYAHYDPDTAAATTNLAAVQLNGQTYRGGSIVVPPTTYTEFIMQARTSGILLISAVSQSDSTMAGGMILVGPNATAYVLASGSSNFAAGNVAGKFCVLNAGGNNIAFYSYLGPTFDVTVTMVANE